MTPAPWSKPQRAVAETPSKYRTKEIVFVAMFRSDSMPPYMVLSRYTLTWLGD